MKKITNLFPRLFCAYQMLLKTVLNFWNGQLYLFAWIFEGKCLSVILQWDLVNKSYSKLAPI